MREMSAEVSRRGLMLAAAAGACGIAAPGLGVTRGLDPWDANIRFGTTGSIFGHWTGEVPKTFALQMSTDMRMMLRACKSYGLEGFGPYSTQVVDYVGRPLALKKLLAETGMTLASLGDLPRMRPAAAAAVAPAAGPTQFPWLGGAGRAQLIADMVACARDFLQPLSVDHWKNNMGARPDGGPSDDQLKALANTANELGRQTLAHGVRLSLHPHLWGPMEREHEFRRVMELTDPKYVFLILDTGHNVLGGMDPVKITEEFFPRITELHLKDTFARYRGNKATPTRVEHLTKTVYASVGQGGGVDFPGIFRVLRARKFKGWAMFDIDAPRADEGTGTVHDNLVASVNYMRDVLKVRLPRPPRTSPFTETI